MDYQQINDYLVDIFNNVLVIEENSLKTSRFKDLSIKEMHTIDEIGKKPDVTPSEIAETLMVTLGTVTTSLNKLEAKGYIVRTRSTIDRRVVHLGLTKKGRLIYRLHRRFHRAMVTRITDGMEPAELEVMQRGLKKLHQFLEELK
ncbi:fatty acid biosynthesis transcriptional regulator FabT [Streptococcus sp. 10F2]